MQNLIRLVFSTVLILLSAQVSAQGFNYELISDWDTLTPNWQGGGNNFVYEVVANPDTTGINPSDSCAHFVSSNSVWDLIKLDLGTAANFQEYPIYWVKILAPPTGGDVWFKLENNDNTQSVTRNTTPTPGAWQQVKFDFTGEASGVFTRLVIFLDFDNSTPGHDWYIDDVARSEEIPDTLAPSRPENLVVSDTFPGRVRLTWDASTDDVGVTNYKVFTDGVQSGNSATSSTEVQGLIPKTNYAFFVIAEDAAGNQSLPSDTISASTPETGNTDIIRSVSVLNSQAGLYDKVEIRVNLESVHQDPYDPNDVRVDLNLTQPDGSEFILPCFYESGPPQNSRFLARFSPRQLGTYRGTFSVEDLAGSDVSDPVSFEVVASDREGFLHVDPASPYTLRFDSGKSFRGLGENFGWEARIDLGDDQTYTYAYMFNVLAEQKANFVRTWMCPWNLPLEWKKTDFGRYQDTDQTYNVSAMDRLDYMLAEAEKNGIYLMLALDYHGALKTEADVWGGNNYWKDHNYQVAQGGPATSPGEFFTHPEARRLYQNRLRYLVARWGYHPHIAAWEFWNEVDNAQADENIPVQDVVNWHHEMANYLKTIDPNEHIVTTSVSHRELQGLFAVPDIDLSQSHLYGVTDQIPSRIESFNQKYQKPYVVGEFAHDWNNPGLADMPDYEKDFRRGLWLGMFSPTPILPMTWWWIEFDKGKLNRQYAIAADYMKVMLEDPHTGIEAALVNPNVSIKASALKASGHYFLWLRNENETMVTGEQEILNVENGNWYITEYNTTLGRFDTLQQWYVDNHILPITAIQIPIGGDIAYVIRQDRYYVEADTSFQVPLASQLTLSPNPVAGKLLVNNETRIATVRIVDLQGREVFRIEDINSNWIELDLQGLISGTYVLIIDTVDGKSAQGKFVKL